MAKHRVSLEKLKTWSALVSPKDDKNGVPHTGRNFLVIGHVFLLLMYCISKRGQLHAELVVDIGTKG